MSLRQARLTTVLLLLLGYWGTSVGQPTELFTCVSNRDPDCGSSYVTVIDVCGPSPREFTIFSERVAWFPLQYASPITIEIEGSAAFSSQVPVYVEVVPLSETPPATFCYDGHPGYVLGIFRGGGNVCGGAWERFGPYSLEEFHISPGGLYALQLTFFSTHEKVESPGIDCLRVLTGVAGPAGVAMHTWGRTKALYR